MKKIGLIIAVLSLSSAYVFGQHIVIDSEQKNQTIEGWGASLAWWANLAGTWSHSDVDTVCKWMAEELNMNIFRYNIAGGDSSGHDHMRKDGGKVPSYKVAENAEYDWLADSGQQRILKTLCALRDDEICEAVSYSPPYWMTISGCSAGNTNGEENLKLDYYDDFATYLCDVVKYFNDTLKIPFRTIAPINEPGVTWWKFKGKQEGCGFGVEYQKKIIVELYKELKEQDMLGYCSISTNDANNIDKCVSSVQSFEKDTAIINKLSQFNTHSYHGEKHMELAELAKKHDKNLWQSESSPLWVKKKGLANHLYMAQRIIKDIKYMKVNAWIDWQFMSTSEVWGMVTANYKNKTYTKNKNFYVRKQMSAFILPEYQIVETSSDSTLAAISPDNKELVVVAVNEAGVDKKVDFDLSSFQVKNDNVRVYRTSIDEDCKQIQSAPISNNVLSTLLKTTSITTFVIPLKAKNKKRNKRD